MPEGIDVDDDAHGDDEMEGFAGPAPALETATTTATATATVPMLIAPSFQCRASCSWHGGTTTRDVGRHRLAPAAAADIDMPPHVQR